MNMQSLQALNKTSDVHKDTYIQSNVRTLILIYLNINLVYFRISPNGKLFLLKRLGSYLVRMFAVEVLDGFQSPVELNKLVWTG